MSVIEAIVLGIIQGLTEFLPVSSSGHLEIGKVILDADIDQSLLFTVVVHGATVLSTIVVFFHEIVKILKGSLSSRINESNLYILKIVLSMLPVLLIGLFFEEKVESYFSGDLGFVGIMLLITAGLLFLSSLIKKDRTKKIGFSDAFIIGIAQAIAVLPGISRSGSTIATGILLGNKREEVAQFSFLMVLLPIIGANVLSILDFEKGVDYNGSATILIAGFVAAFLSGLLACRWMINIVKRGKLYYFAIYCTIIGLIAIVFA